MKKINLKPGQSGRSFAPSILIGCANGLSLFAAALGCDWKRVRWTGTGTLPCTEFRLQTPEGGKAFASYWLKPGLQTSAHLT